MHPLRACTLLVVAAIGDGPAGPAGGVVYGADAIAESGEISSRQVNTTVTEPSRWEGTGSLVGSFSIRFGPALFVIVLLAGIFLDGETGFCLAEQYAFASSPVITATMTRQVSGPNYHSIDHTAVQTCGWTKNALRGEGTCYKHDFYGIRSHRCVQMTPVVRCNERCVFCWRDHAGHTYTLDDVDWEDPEAVVDASIELQRELLAGFGGNDDVPAERLEEATDPQHVAISLDGEPTLYPHLPELIEAYHDRGMTTFLVSNGTRPEVLREAEPTQLYVSVDAPDQETFGDVVGPMEESAWEDLLSTLDVLAAKRNTRTVIRTTLVKGENMHDPAGYASLFSRADPDFVELKGYMHVGHSRDRLDRETMPDHAEVVAFAEAVQEHLSEHGVLREAEPSNVAMLARDEDTWVPALRPE